MIDTKTGQPTYAEAGHDECYQLEDQSFWFQFRNQIIDTALKAHQFAPNLIDIGAGNGCVSHHLQHQGFNMLALEPGSVGAANCRERGLLHVAEGYFADWVLRIKNQENLNSDATIKEPNSELARSPDLVAAASFDQFLGGAILADVIEHLDDPIALLAEVRGCLKPNAKVLVTVPAYQWLWSDADTAALHRKRYTKALLKNELAAAGFEVEHLSYFFSYLVLPIWFTRTVPDYLKNHLALPRHSSDTTRGPQFAKAQAEHVRSSLTVAGLAQLHKYELNCLAHKKSVAFGSSLLAVARASV